MRQQKYLFALLGLLLLGAAVLGCDSANPVAPSGSVLTVSANPTQIGLGEISTITVTGFKPDGNPLNPGSRITLTTDLGTLDVTVVEINDLGNASTILRPDGRTGAATVTAALSAGEAMATATVNIGESAETKPTLSITVTPSTLDLNETAVVAAQARNADGSNFGSGGRVRLRTSLGQLDSENLVTDANGEAQTVFRTGSDPGTATITGSVESSDEITAEVTIENQKPRLIVNVNPDNVAVQQDAVVTVLARDNNDNPLGAGEQIQLFASLGSIPSVVSTNANGRAEATFNAGDQAGTASIQAVLRNSDPATVSVTIRDAVREFIFTVNPTTIDRPAAGGAGETIRLTGIVRNAQGEPLSNILVTYTSPEVGGTFQTISGVSSNGTIQTGGDGVAELDLTVTSTGIGETRASFVVEAIVISEGETFTRRVTISVRG